MNTAMPGLIYRPLGGLSDALEAPVLRQSRRGRGGLTFAQRPDAPFSTFILYMPVAGMAMSVATRQCICC